jgi:hypothetical protein
LAEEEEEEDLSYNDVANLTGASPLVHRAKSKTSSKPTSKAAASPVKKTAAAQAKPKDSPVSSLIAPGTKVRISNQAEKHTQFRGKVPSSLAHTFLKNYI